MSDAQGNLFAEIVVRQLREKPGQRVLIVAHSEERGRVLVNLIGSRLTPEEQGLLTYVEVEVPQ